ncbi:hypothetical protein F4780DRAFT_450201 [Xylariomycetidae sp. FL0641]|nr:hypothetical protein F4780DRAFT_450201 [Xylariomycetidae sp. FL0641]
MADLQSTTTCNDCIGLLKTAASMISSLCRADDEPEVWFDAQYQARLKTSLSSSQCHMCVLLSTARPRLLEPFGRNELCMLGWTFHSYSCVKMIFAGENRLDESNEGLIWAQNATTPGVHTSVLESHSTWSLQTMNRIRNWMASCTLSHDKCNQAQGEGGLPRRLIDVMPTPFDHRWPMEDMRLEDFDHLSIETLPNVRIISTAKSSLPPDTPYITLSHRWGYPEELLLSRMTSFLLGEDICPHLLKHDEAAVFRHAIHVTRALGMRYIWIDALCIMQDDPCEKGEDILKMDEVYANCALNISAAEAQVRQGLFFDREVLGTNPNSHQAVVNVPRTGEKMQIQVFGHECSVLPDHNPLSTRGWYLQERALAPRIVHFKKDQVYWECASLNASEVLPRGGPRFRPVDEKSVVLSPTVSPEHLRKRWYQMVRIYSATSLTFIDDRLLAISALAKRFCSALRLDSSQYLAGMWKDDLPLSMLWFEDPKGPAVVDLEPTNTVATESKHAPSWSWASISGRVRFPNHVQNISSYKPQTPVEVLEIEASWASPNPFDGTDFCRMRICGPVYKVTRRSRHGVPRIYAGQDPIFLEGDINSGGHRVVGFRWDRCRKTVAELLTLSHEWLPSPPVYLFPFFCSLHDWRGIVLQRSEKRGTYSRVGYFDILLRRFYLYEKDNLKYPIANTLYGCLNILTADEYLDRGPDGKYTIDIV